MNKTFTTAQTDFLTDFFTDRPRMFKELFHVVDKQGEIVPFVFNPAQVDIYSKLSGRDIILKARQLGFSTLVAAEFLLDAITIPNLRVLVIVQNEDAIPKFSLPIHNEVGTGLYDLLPEHIEVGGVKIKFRPDIVTDNISTLAFDNGSIINVITSGGTKLGRGQTVHRAHMTEVGFWDKDVADTVWAAVEGAMPPLGSKLIVESTAFGQQGKFFKEWKRAVNGESLFTPHFYNWPWAPEYRLNVTDLPLKLGGPPPSESELAVMERYSLDEGQLMYRRSKMAALGTEFLQEYPETPDEAFIATGSSIFTEAQRDFARSFIRPPLEGDEGGWQIWEDSEPDGFYAVIIDSSQGITDAADFDVVTVLKINTPYVEEVARWRGKVTQREVAERSVGIAKRYNLATIVPEVVDGSGQTIRYILDEVMNYPKIYMRDDGEYGWKTTRWNKPMMVDSFRELLNRQWFRTGDELVADEMTTYVEHRLPSGAISVGATSGAYDDVLTTIMIGAAVLPQLSRTRSKSTHYGRKKW